MRINLSKYPFISLLLGFVCLIGTTSVLADNRLWAMDLKCDENVDLTFQNGKVYNQTLIVNSEGNELQLKSEDFYDIKGMLKGSLKIKLNPKLNIFKYTEWDIWIDYTLIDGKLNGWGKLDGEVDCSLSGTVTVEKTNAPVFRPSSKKTINQRKITSGINQNPLSKKSLSTKQLCLFATVNGQYWENEGTFSAYLQEARRRGLELEDCPQVGALYGSEKKSVGIPKDEEIESESKRRLQWQLQHAKRFWELNKKNILGR